MVRKSKEGRRSKKSVDPILPTRPLYIIPTVIREAAEDDADEEEGVNRTSYEDADTIQHYFSDQLRYKRAKWVKPWFAMVSMIAASIDVSCVSSFPETVANNGGLAFWIAYMISHATIVLPYLYMEAIIGQYFQISMIGIWEATCPLFKGISVGAFVTCFLLTAFNPTVIVWATYMMYEGWGAIRTNQLTWATCNNIWNTCTCDGIHNIECDAHHDEDDHEHNAQNSAASEYFLAVILKVWTTKYADPGIITNVIDNGNSSLSYGFHSEQGLGNFIVDSGLILTGIFIIMLLVIGQSATISGYVYTFSTTFPIVVLVLLICRGVSLSGGISGIVQYMSPDFSKLLDHHVWTTAAHEAFFSMTAGMGIHLATASFNPLHHDILKDVVGCIVFDSITRILGCIGMFSFVGHLHHIKNHPLPDVYVGKFMLFPFTDFAEAIAHVSGAGFFAFLFFMMIIVFALDTCTVIIQTIIHALYEEFRRKYPDQTVSENIFLFSTFGFCFSMAMLTVTRGGVWVALFAVRYNYGFSFNMFSAIQSVVFPWIWGVENLCNAGKTIYGKPPHLMFRICWKFVVPTVLIGFMVVHILNLYFEPIEELGERSPDGTIPFAIGSTFLSLGIFLVYTVFAIIKGFKNGKGCLTSLMLMLSPAYEHDEIKQNVWNAKRLHLKHYLFLRYPDEISNSPLKDRIRGTISRVGNRVSTALTRKSRVHVEQEKPPEHEHHHHHHHHDPNLPRQSPTAWSLLSAEIPHDHSTHVYGPVPPVPPAESI